MTRLWSAALALALAAPSAAAVYEIDPQHSSVGFSVAHLMISRVSGRFNKFQGSFTYEEKKPAVWKAEAAIDTASIDTNVEARDKHLRSPDFFNVDKFPQMTFKSTRVEGLKGKKAKLHGELTLLGVTKPVVLDLEVRGSAKDPWGGLRAAFTARTTIDRKAFGMTWNKALDTGGVMVGDEVEIVLEVEGVAKKP